MTERIQFIVEMDIHRGHGYYQTDESQLNWLEGAIRRERYFRNSNVTVTRIYNEDGSCPTCFGIAGHHTTVFDQEGLRHKASLPDTFGRADDRPFPAWNPETRTVCGIYVTNPHYDPNYPDARNPAYNWSNEEENN